MKINKSVKGIMGKVGRRWDIIEKLYEKPSGLTELAEKLGKKDSQVLRELKEDLLPYGIVEKKGKGRETKYVLTEDARTLVDAILNAFAALKGKEKPKFTEADARDLKFFYELYKDKGDLYVYEALGIMSKKDGFLESETVREIIMDLLEDLRDLQPKELRRRISYLSHIPGLLKECDNSYLKDVKSRARELLLNVFERIELAKRRGEVYVSSEDGVEEAIEGLPENYGVLVRLIDFSFSILGVRADKQDVKEILSYFWKLPDYNEDYFAKRVKDTLRDFEEELRESCKEKIKSGDEREKRRAWKLYEEIVS
ncbi:hypothetical protein DRP04_04840 [Archaeoglobales archaeon]|nr:MAG: hypothetical protein DRP04_04840 [Archaeoglobales archaeon]